MIAVIWYFIAIMAIFNALTTVRYMFDHDYIPSRKVLPAMLMTEANLVLAALLIAAGVTCQ